MTRVLTSRMYRSGKWAHLDRVPVERARQSVIANVFIDMNFPNGSILDVGCGEGSSNAHTTMSSAPLTTNTRPANVRNVK